MKRASVSLRLQRKFLSRPQRIWSHTQWYKALLIASNEWMNGYSQVDETIIKRSYKEHANQWGRQISYDNDDDIRFKTRLR